MVETRAVLVVDDERERLDPFAAAIGERLAGAVQVETWLPHANEDPLQRFAEEAEKGLALIVTDQDLTKSGLGLLGSSITTWAQDLFIPVCNFSRQQQRKLPRESNFFELRVPSGYNDQGRADYVARIYDGFGRLRSFIADAGVTRPTAALLAGAMGLPALEDDVAPYLASVASANTSFMQAVLNAETRPSEAERIEVLAFIFGHVIINAILEYPGPIMSAAVLASYCAVSESMSAELATVFAAAEYVGPFATEGTYFQRRIVDKLIDEFARDTTATEFAEADQYTRGVIESKLGSVAPHTCQRCGGTRGGYWCPLTRRAVCIRNDCSVPSNAWIPRGATLCRFEKNHYEELAPLLGE